MYKRKRRGERNEKGRIVRKEKERKLGAWEEKWKRRTEEKKVQKKKK